jgi:hypothetical protein
MEGIVETMKVKNEGRKSVVKVDGGWRDAR